MEDNYKVIKQKDPLIETNPHLDFQWLRSVGLSHIGELSGKIWTDHNTHDPGITILEVLCYALIDLGYRTTLPIEDLLAIEKDSKDPFAQDDNFFTPFQILSCNPTTINDFRKLLLEVDGVRNVWLEVSKDQETKLWLKEKVSGSKKYKLSCDNKIDNQEKLESQIFLNGIYEVSVELEPDADQKIEDIIKSLLASHRNLCEDFKEEIIFLEPCKVGIEAVVEIRQDAIAEKIYEAIIQKTEEYISPRIQHFTLNQLLDKGFPIEQIFPGRPYLHSSFGFVDTEELTRLKLKKELYASDLYRIILSIEGVVSIGSLCFKSDSNVSLTGNIQILSIPDGKAASFSESDTQIQFRSGRGELNFKNEIVKSKWNQSKKSRLAKSYLDVPVPKGNFIPGLKDYISIQNEFPAVYGIAEGGLPAESTQLRKIQAFQLKGYLLFYDQILANYLAQLSNLRSLFSLNSESKTNQTFFAQNLDNVPDLKKLLKLSENNENSSGNVIAIPVPNSDDLEHFLINLKQNPHQHSLKINNNCNEGGIISPFADSSSELLGIRIQNIQRYIDRGNYKVEFFEDKEGYFFMIRMTQLDQLLLLGTERFRNINEAEEAANMACFMASDIKNFNKNSIKPDNSEEIEFQFTLIYRPTETIAYLHHLLEDEKRYNQRREAFLDHLLARFAHQFTDFTLVRFGSNLNEKPKLIEDKSKVLNKFDDLSRNRGRAFNYKKSGWNTKNVSGFEKRISFLTSMADWKRRSLCKFEVVERFRVEVQIPYTEKVLFSSGFSFSSKQELRKAKIQLINQLKSPDNYKFLRKKFPAFDSDSAQKFFSEIPIGENIVPSTYVYKLALRDDKGETEFESSKSDFPSQVSAEKAIPNFIKEIKKNSGSEIELVQLIEKSNLYFNKQKIKIEPITRFQWNSFDDKRKLAKVSENIFETEEEAKNDYVKNINSSSCFFQKENAPKWSFSPISKIPLVSFRPFVNEQEAQRDWLRSKNFGLDSKNYKVTTTSKEEVIINLTNAHGNPIGVAHIPDRNKITPGRFIQACVDFFGKNNPKIQYRSTEKAYGWKLNDQGGKTLLVCIGLFEDPIFALEEYLEALNSVSEQKNFFSTGSDDNPEYRILLRSSMGQFIATSPPPYFSDEKKRNEELKFLKKSLKQVVSTFQIKEVPKKFKWQILSAPEEIITIGSTKEFDSEENAKSNLGILFSDLNQYQEKPEICNHVYSVETHEIPFKYQFIYPGGVEEAFLKSEIDFSSEDEAKEAYKEFIRSFPILKIKKTGQNVKIFEGEKPIATLRKEILESEQRVEKLLEFLPQNFSESEPLTIQSPHWIYRYLDKERPLAKMVHSPIKRSEVEELHNIGCKFQPFQFDDKKIVQILCPKSNPEKFHFAICLRFDFDEEIPFLMSYLGYDTHNSAKEAGEKNWIKLIEIATKAENYGLGKLISLEEKYGSISPDICDSAESLLGVIPEAFLRKFRNKEECIEAATKVSNQFPIRRKLKKKRNTTNQEEIKGYIFQGFDINVKKILWKSSKKYMSVNEAIEAYRLFQIVLENPDSCRIICHNGKYKVHLIEILAESLEYKCEDDAWDELKRKIQDPCGNNSCENRGIKLFSDSALSDSGYLFVEFNNSYSFKVIAKNYWLAKHKVQYSSKEKSQVAINELFRDAKNLDCQSLLSLQAKPDQKEKEIMDENLKAFYRRIGEQPIFEREGTFWFRLISPDFAKILDKPLEECGCEKPESKDPDSQDLLYEKAFLFESTNSYPTKEAAEEAFLHFCNLLKSKENYEIKEESGVGPYTIYIIDPDKIIANHPNYHPDRNSATLAAKRIQKSIQDDGLHLLEHILLRPKIKNAKECSRLLPVCPDLKCKLEWQEDPDENNPNSEEENLPMTYIPGSDPYSFWATVVLPAWVSRFQTEESRYFFRQMLHKEAPALVALNILWLSPKQMCRFERAFQNWLHWFRATKKENCRASEDPYCDLVKCLIELRNDVSCASSELQSEKLKKEEMHSDSLIDSLEESQYLFWHECVPKEKIPDGTVQKNPDVRSENTKSLLSNEAQPKKEGFRGDANLIRETLEKRKDAYLRSISEIEDLELNKKAKILIENPNLEIFINEVNQISQGGLKEKENKTEIESLLKNITFRHFDQELQQVPEAFDSKKRLAEMIAKIQGLGIDTSIWSVDWKGSEIADLLNRQKDSDELSGFLIQK